MEEIISPKILLKLWKLNGKVLTYRRMSIKRFSSICRSYRWTKAYIYVGYGRGKNASGKIVNFHNDGTYFNKQGVTWALRVFAESD